MSRRDFLYAPLLLAPLIMAQPVIAQSDAPPAEAGTEAAQPAPARGGYDALQDIVVTAQKRSQNVQSVPIAISAFGSDALTERAIVDVSALGNISPSTTFTAGSPFSGSTAVLSAFVRGIGSNEFAINLDPGVGIYLDGVYLARTIGANVDLPDVERVEILKGPQGTLFGRNTIGGAVSVVTRDPGDKLRLRGEVTTGRFNRLDAQASLDLPVTDSVSSLFTVALKNRQGFQKRIPFESPIPFVADSPSAIYPQYTPFTHGNRQGGEDSWTLRGKVKFDNGGRFRLTLGGDYLKVDQSALNNSVLAILPLPGALGGLAQNNIPGTALDVTTGTSGFNLVGLYNFCIGANPAQIAARNLQGLCGMRGTPLNPSGQLPPLGGATLSGNPLINYLPYDNRFIAPGKDLSYATGGNYSQIRSYSVTGTLEYDVTDTLKLKSITSYRDLKFAAGIDADGSPLPILELSFPITQHQFSEELQLAGKALDDRLNYVFGLYYFTESANQTDIAILDDGLLTNVSPYHQNTKNGAAFGQIDWRISDLIGITVGGRYTKERKNFSSEGGELNGLNYKLFNCTTYGPPCSTALGYPDPSNPLGYYPPGVFTRTFNNFSPKFGIDLHPAQDLMVYGSYSQGYKTGGFVQRLGGPSFTAPSFGPEKAKTFEAGIKSRLFDRKLQLNLAAFTTKYDNIQMNFQIGATPTIQNAGTARIKGLELEANAALADGLSVSSSISYTHARFTDVLGPAVVSPDPFHAGVFEGSPLPKTPEWKVNISPRYETSLGNGGRLIQTVDYTFQSKTWNDTERTYLLAQPKTHILSASLAYVAPDERYRITVGGTNLLGERYITNGLAQLAGGLIYGTYSRPIEWYAKINFDF